MQASTTVPYYFPSTEARTRSLSLRFPSPLALAITAAVLMMTSSVPDAGVVYSGQIQPLSDSAVDLTLADVVEHLNERLPSSYRRDSYKLGRLVLELADRHQFSPAFLLSVIDTESSYRPTIVSKAGAIGLMQLLPGTAAEMAEKFGIKGYQGESDLVNPAINLKLGVAYLAHLRKQFGTSLHYVAAYNLGPTALRRKLREGNYELGALDSYVRKIHDRSRLLRGDRVLTQSRSQRRAEVLARAI